MPSDEGPHRKYYGITPAGRTLLARQRADWDRFSSTVTALLTRRSDRLPDRASDVTPEAGPAPTQPLTQGVHR